MRVLPFHHVTLLAQSGGQMLNIGSVDEATEFLLQHWPNEKGRKYKAARQTCLDALQGRAAGKDSFAADPPNATVSVLKKDGSDVLDAVVTLNAPKMEGDNLSFDVEVLEGSLEGADGPASTFIDIIGMPFTPRSFAGVARRTAFRGAWYGGAVAAGAAMAYPYYQRPACGPYPYPPCY
jgi:hypothetical protein